MKEYASGSKRICAEKADQISDASVLSCLPGNLSSYEVSTWLYYPCVFSKFVVEICSPDFALYTEQLN